MRFNLDKNLDKDVLQIIKAAIGYPPKLSKSEQMFNIKLQNIGNFEQTVPPFNMPPLGNFSVTKNYLLTLNRL